jgi:hypothetical protein
MSLKLHQMIAHFCISMQTSEKIKTCYSSISGFCAILHR